MHLQRLRDAEIKLSFELPAKKDILLLGSSEPNDRNHHRDDNRDTDSNNYSENGNNLRRILAAAEALFRSAYILVSDRLQDQKIIYQYIQTLSDFASSTSKKGKDIAFRNFKNLSILTTYFRKIKELLVYYYQVVYRKDRHFTQEEED